ncbi:MAG: hypothetical protein ACR2GY_01355 [Phycisphaerales bacterium]
MLKMNMMLPGLMRLAAVALLTALTLPVVGVASASPRVDASSATSFIEAGTVGMLQDGSDAAEAEAKKQRQAERARRRAERERQEAQARAQAEKQQRKAEERARQQRDLEHMRQQFNYTRQAESERARQQQQQREAAERAQREQQDRAREQHRAREQQQKQQQEQQRQARQPQESQQQQQRAREQQAPQRSQQQSDLDHIRRQFNYTRDNRDNESSAREAQRQQQQQQRINNQERNSRDVGLNDQAERSRSRVLSSDDVRERQLRDLEAMRQQFNYTRNNNNNSNSSNSRSREALTPQRGDLYEVNAQTQPRGQQQQAQTDVASSRNRSSADIRQQQQTQQQQQQLNDLEHIRSQFDYTRQGQNDRDSRRPGEIRITPSKERAESVTRHPARAHVNKSQHFGNSGSGGFGSRLDDGWKRVDDHGHGRDHGPNYTSFDRPAHARYTHVDRPHYAVDFGYRPASTYTHFTTTHYRSANFWRNDDWYCPPRRSGFSISFGFGHAPARYHYYNYGYSYRARLFPAHRHICHAHCGCRTSLIQFRSSPTWWYGYDEPYYYAPQPTYRETVYVVEGPRYVSNYQPSDDAYWQGSNIFAEDNANGSGNSAGSEPFAAAAIDPIDEAWRLLADGFLDEARNAFAGLSALSPLGGEAEIGLSIASGLLNDRVIAITAMRAAMRDDAAAIDRVPANLAIREHIRSLLDVWASQDTASGAAITADVLFMTAALRAAADEDAVAFFAIDEAITAGDHSDAAEALRAHLHETMTRGMF